MNELDFLILFHYIGRGGQTTIVIDVQTQNNTLSVQYTQLVTSVDVIR